MRPLAFSLNFLLLFLTIGLPAQESTGFPEKNLIRDNWTLRSSCDLSKTGDEISRPGFAVRGWHRTQVPTTVVAALVADKTYPDPSYGLNLKKFPGMNYSNGNLFANQDMPADSPFRCSWWFRTEFIAPASLSGKHKWLHFDGINYRANVWLNGKKIADAKDVAGMFRQFEFDITPLVSAGKKNALAVEIFAPEKNDLALTWVDWNPTPPDKDMGLWKDVYLTGSGDVSLRHGFVATRLSADHTQADLTIRADLRNLSDREVRGTLQAEVAGVRADMPVVLKASESKSVTIAPEQFPELRLQHPQLWWPYQMGTPSLYSAKLRFEIAGGISDSMSFSFGAREITSELTDKGDRLFKINGRNVLIRGAADAPDMLLRYSPERMQAGLDYVRDMGLNTIRLEGRMNREEFFDAADRMGILIMPGWTCCDAWEKWENWGPEQHQIAAASMADQARRLRNHASVFVWLYGSDGPPPAEVEQTYLKVLQDQNWPNPSISSAAAVATTVSGSSGVKMTGPYEYVPPNYWLVDSQAGGAFGYNTETSPGEAIPPIESLKRFIPADHLWPIDEYWNYHAGLERFTNIDIFSKAMSARYGAPASLNDFERKAQAMAYEGERAMFEAYGRNKYTSTGVIQWMLNNAWPSLIWHLYDYYLVPAGGYFGTKKAMEMAHVQYSYDDNSVAVVNGYDHPLQNMKVSAAIYAPDGKQLAVRDATLTVAADASAKALDVPQVSGLSGAYFLKLQLADAADKLLSDNFYWLSTKLDEIDFAARKNTVYTPQSGYADLTALNNLPPVHLTARKQSGKQGNRESIRVTLRNPSKSVAFLVHLRLTHGVSGEDVVPIFWQDDYISLLPGEKREIFGTFDAAKLNGKEPVLHLDGWNVPATIVGNAADRRR